MNVYEQVEKNIDALVENNVDWSACATSDEMEKSETRTVIHKFF